MGILVVGFGGVVVGLLGLVTAAAGKAKPWLQVVLAVGVVLVWVFSCVGLWHTNATAIKCLSLVYLGLVLVLVPFSPFGRIYHWLAAQMYRRRSRLALWAAVLVCSPVGALYLAIQEEGKLPALAFPNPDRLAEFREDKNQLTEVEHACATTDKGQPIKLYIPEGIFIPAPNPDLVLQQSQLVKNVGLNERVIRLSLGWQNCNCHGWVFTGGQFWIRGESVSHILQDNGYYQVSWPRAGDLAIYRDPQGLIVHSGIVRYIGADNTILVESKWGRLGRFLHMHDLHCYDQAPCTFYRSRRPGHILYGLPRPSLHAPSDNSAPPEPPYYFNEGDQKNNSLFKTAQ